MIDKGSYCIKTDYILTENRQAYMIPRLMQALPFPDKINPWQLAAERGRLEGELPLAALPRLAAVNRATGQVGVSLEAGIDEGGISFIRGTLQADLELDCQRCLRPFYLPMTVEVDLGLVRAEADAERLPDRYEPLLVAETGLVVADLVEDELLLALPQIPRHEDLRACEANGYATEMPNTPLPQPFAALASLLADSKRST